MKIQASLRVLADSFEIHDKALDQERFFALFDARLVPVGHLDADEHADDHDQEVEEYREPVLVSNVLRETAQDHRGSSGVAGSRVSTSRLIRNSPSWRCRMLAYVYLSGPLGVPQSKVPVTTTAFGS